MENIGSLYSGPTLSIVFIVFCIVMVALLASSEAAILSINKIKVRHLAKQKNKSALAIQEMLKKPEKLFSTILTTENMFIIFASSLGTGFAIEHFGHQSTVIVSIILTFIIVVLGEITPKTFAAQNADSYGLLVARPLSFLVKILSPVILLFTYLTQSILKVIKMLGISSSSSKYSHYSLEELKMLIEEGSLPSYEKDLLKNIFEFTDTVAMEIMVPRTKIKALKVTHSIKKALKLASQTGYSRFPVYENSLDNILGILYIKDLIRALGTGQASSDFSIKNFIRKTIFVPENKKIDELLRIMQKKHIYMAIVADEFGGTKGLITLEDILEEIVGDIDDERTPTDKKELIIQKSDKLTLIVPGDITIFDINNKLPRELPYGKYNTIAGFILYNLKQIPKEGDKFIFDNFEIIVNKISGTKIQEVKIIDLES